MDYTRNEDYYRNYWGYGAELAGGLYNGCHNMAFSSEGSEPVSLAEVLAWGKIDQNIDNSLLTALITTARIMCEQYTNTGLIARTIAADINNANGGFILPYGPVTSTPTAVDYNGDSLTLVYNFSQLQTPYGRMTVTYNAGYTTSNIPEIYKTAIMQQTLFLYENRGDESAGVSPIAKQLLNPLIRYK